ncbi:MAG: hypothetical protein Q8862_10175 [Bacteroidota bacterium]|nr:hypothetical protein [Bacteroidota bacterium]MDP4205989.1 hypothetical protein [Bacteroidota bacterium]
MSNNYRLNKFLKIFGAGMVLVYIGLGVLMLFTPYFNETIPKTNRYLIGIALIGYGAYRFYRTLKTKQYEDDQE